MILTNISRHLLSSPLITSCCFVLLGGCDQVRSKPFCNAYFDQTDHSGYELMGGGMALHLSSDTVWYRCPAGQYFRDAACLGEPLMLNWEEANRFAEEFSENSTLTWRLPSNNEFQAITTSNCLNPAVNTNVFPQLPVDNFWTLDRANVASSGNCLVYSYQGRIACREPRSALHEFMLVAKP